ncbi:tetratricopeptide repeat protein [Rhodospirillum centenum]|uniref:TPR domain protein n=1 Tax=Rhodospirillum centenum (strain ATCC 51521 / SW) TaxID=414684 RepID=B6IRZ9_RHOCS|nr:tetratricopeptide repeat protein [Rhodospirillum centenum]ACI98235.1 TPR domain protein [Rhodospirillum centenum SW]
MTMDHRHASSRRRRWLAALLLGLPMAVAGVSGTAYAQRAAGDDQKAEQEDAAKKGQVLTERTFKQVTEAQKAIEEKRYAQAQQILDGLLKGELQPYERAIVLQTMGYVFTEQDNYRRAAEIFEQALALKILPDAQQHSLLYNLAQLYMATDQFQKSLQKFKEWFAVAQNPQAEAYVAYANVYAQLEDMRSAIPLMEKAISMSPNPKKEWYDFILGLYFETKQFTKVADTLELLISRYPKEKRYYIQLAGIYSEIKKEKETLAVMELAYKAGHLDKSEELVQLAQLWMYHDVPYRGALLLQANMEKGRIKGTKENWELLANAWIASREIPKSIDPLRRAAELSNDGEGFIRLAQAYLEREDWKNAVDALEKGIAKGGLKNQGSAFLLEGVASFNLKDLDKAERAFNRAAEFSSTARTARQWLTHVQKAQLAEQEKAEQAAAVTPASAPQQ